MTICLFHDHLVVRDIGTTEEKLALALGNSIKDVSFYNSFSIRFAINAVLCIRFSSYCTCISHINRPQYLEQPGEIEFCSIHRVFDILLLVFNHISIHA